MEGWRYFPDYRLLLKVAEGCLPLADIDKYQIIALRPGLGRLMPPNQLLCLQSMAPRPSPHVYHPWKAGGTSSIIAQVVDKGSGGLPTS
jgi:hypothetical protein